MEQIAEVAAWATQVVDETSAQGTFQRAEANALQSQMNDQAGANQRQTNAEATSAKEAIDEEADTWATASKTEIDADTTRALADINAAREANDLDAKSDCEKTKQEVTANTRQDRANLEADHAAEVLEINADKTQEESTANVEYARLWLMTPQNVVFLVGSVMADLAQAGVQLVENVQFAKKSAEQDRDAAIAAAKLRLDENVRQAGLNLEYIRDLPLTAFQSDITPGLAVTFQWAYGPSLDDSVNFMTGWADGFTSGGWSMALSWTGLLDRVDRNSLAYSNGRIAGTVHMVAISFGVGSSCTVTWAVRIGRGMLSLNTGFAMIDAAPRILRGEATVWDVLAFAPAGGWLLGRLRQACFVGETLVHMGSNTRGTTIVDVVATPLIDYDWTEVAVIVTVAAGITLAVSADQRRKPFVLQSARRGPVCLSLENPLLFPESKRTVAGSSAMLTQLQSATEESELDAAFMAGDPLEWRAVHVDEDSEYERMKRPRSLGLACLVACLLLALGWALPAHVSRSAMAGTEALKTQRDIQAARPHSSLLPIRDIETGMKVAAENPQLAGMLIPSTQIDPATWRNIRLRMEKPDGGNLLITLLRSLEWLNDQDAKVNGQITFSFPELGIEGPAQVLGIDPCPSIDPGPGRVVTGTFRHSAANVIDLHVSSEPVPIGTTTNHPFWSETRQAFVPAGSLQPGEELRTATGNAAFVTGQVARQNSIPVFNLEVDADHVYAVGEHGALVHNSCAGLDDLARFRMQLGPIPGGGLPNGGVLARLDIGGKRFYGINAHGQNVTLRVNGISRTHAETDVFQQAANAGVRGGRRRLFVDSELCQPCDGKGAVRSLARQLGLAELTIITPLRTFSIIP